MTGRRQARCRLQGVNHRQGRNLRCGGYDGREVGCARVSSGGQTEQRIAVAGGMARSDGQSQTIVGRGSDEVGLHLVQRGVGGNHADGGVRQKGRGGSSGGGRLAVERYLHGVRHPSISSAWAGDERAVVVVVDAAPGVDGHRRADRHAIGQGDAGGTDAPFNGPGGSQALGHRSPGSRPNRARDQRSVGCDRSGRVTRIRVGPHGRLADAQVVKDGRRHDGYASVSGCKPDALLFQPALQADGRRQSECAAAAKHHAMHPVNAADRVEQVGFVGAGRTAAYRNATHCSVAAQYRRTSGGGVPIRPMPGLNAWHAGDSPAAVDVVHCIIRKWSETGGFGRRHGARVWDRVSSFYRCENRRATEPDGFTRRAAAALLPAVTRRTECRTAAAPRVPASTAVDLG